MDPVRKLLVAGAVVLGTALAGTATAARAATHEVAAAGNIATGGLAFVPAATTAAVGDTVRWTNTDFLVPHTATELHGLFDLTGTYGATPLNPPGFGPGDTRERVFEAGTFEYFCEVHPVDMRAVVAVAPKLKVKRVNGKKRLRLTWASAAPAAGQVFDVERFRKGTWKPVIEGTAKAGRTFPGKHGTFRVRLRAESDPLLASDFSPEARI